MSDDHGVTIVVHAWLLDLLADGEATIKHMVGKAWEEQLWYLRMLTNAFG